MLLVPLVEPVGVEPTTPCLQSRCSSQLSYDPKKGKTVTPVVKYHLELLTPGGNYPSVNLLNYLVVTAGLEPATSILSGWQSNLLIYATKFRKQITLSFSNYKFDDLS